MAKLKSRSGGGAAGQLRVLPEPILLSRSSMDVFSNSFAKRPGQYGSTATLAALMSVAMFSACSWHRWSIGGRGRQAACMGRASVGQAAHRDVDIVIVENQRSVNACELCAGGHPRKKLSSALRQRALTRKVALVPRANFSAFQTLTRRLAVP